MYNLTIPETDKSLALQITLQPSAGNPDILIFITDEFGRSQVRDFSARFAGHDIATVDARFLPAGTEVNIQVSTTETPTRAEYTLTVDLFEEGRSVSARDAKARSPHLGDGLPGRLQPTPPQHAYKLPRVRHSGSHEPPPTPALLPPLSA